MFFMRLREKGKIQRKPCIYKNRGKKRIDIISLIIYSVLTPYFRDG